MKLMCSEKVREKMRLIDADEAREKMLKLLDHHLMMRNYSADSATQDCIDVINEATVVDAVEVVRCKNCKHRHSVWRKDGRMKDGGYYSCYCELDTGDPFELGREAQKDDWFCADGERKENNNV